MFKDKVILITGGSGSWGSELTKQLLEKYSPKEVRIYSRGESKQVDMKRIFKSNPLLKFIIGDVRDYKRLEHATYDVDYIFHLAALKHVPVCEQNVEEAVKTHILGTQNVIRVAIKNSIKKVIYISTDKAVNPLNLYGMTKAIGEKLIISANNLSNKTSFVCIRAGNALGSSGSVVPLFRNQILTANKITITNGEMTRFTFPLEEAISLIFKASIDSIGGEIFVMETPALKIEDLADVMIKELGNSDTKKIVIGERPAEKTHELLVSKEESKRTFVSGKYFIILPLISIENIKKKYSLNEMPPLTVDEISSKNERILNHEEIKKMLNREGWLSKERKDGFFSKEEIDRDLMYKNKEYLLDFFKNEGWIKGENI